MKFERSQHTISRKNISENALKVLYRLHKAGCAAYLVGGGVRDLLLQKKPKDFDIVTDVLPQQVRKIFINSRIIGRRFRLVHVYYPSEIIEVSTFRANTEEAISEDDNVYGTIEEDAWRRDFTVNALFYNIADFSVIDFTDGMRDIKLKLIRMIGDPKQRYHEDPVRLLRAIRLAAKLDFEIEAQTEAPILELGHLLQHVPSSRLFDEILKLFFTGYANVTFDRLRHYHYMRILFPETMQAIHEGKRKVDLQLLKLAMRATDQRYHQGQSLNPGFLISILLWPALQKRLNELTKKSNKFYQQLHNAIDDVFTEQNQSVMIPRRLKAMMRSIWVIQFHLQRRRASRALRLLGHRYFRAAIDFLELRVKAGETKHREIYEWWHDLQMANKKDRELMVQKLGNRKGGK